MRTLSGSYRWLRFRESLKGLIGRRRARVTAHFAFTLGAFEEERSTAPQEGVQYGTKVVDLKVPTQKAVRVLCVTVFNSSAHPVTVTSVWLDHRSKQRGNAVVFNPLRPLPAKIEPFGVWETFAPVSELMGHDARSVRVAIDGATVLPATLRRIVPPWGVVAG